MKLKNNLRVCVGVNIRANREKMRLSQKALAAIVKIDPATMNNYEQGGVDIPISRLVALAEALNTTVGELIAETNRPPTQRRNEQAVIAFAKILGLDEWSDVVVLVSGRNGKLGMHSISGDPITAREALMVDEPEVFLHPYFLEQIQKSVDPADPGSDITPSLIRESSGSEGTDTDGLEEAAD